MTLSRPSPKQPNVRSNQSVLTHDLVTKISTASSSSQSHKNYANKNRQQIFPKLNAKKSAPNNQKSKIHPEHDPERLFEYQNHTKIFNQTQQNLQLQSLTEQYVKFSPNVASSKSKNYTQYELVNNFLHFEMDEEKILRKLTLFDCRFETNSSETVSFNVKEKIARHFGKEIFGEGNFIFVH